jgi:hypothetical protein
MSNALRIVGAACACAFLVAGCGGSKKSESGGSTESEGSTTMIAGLTANDHGTKQVSGQAEVELDDFYFEPTVLEGKRGAKATRPTTSRSTHSTSTRTWTQARTRP